MHIEQCPLSKYCQQNFRARFKRRGILRTVFFVALQHVYVHIPLPRMIPTVEIRDLSEEGPREFGKGMKPNTIDNDV